MQNFLKVFFYYFSPSASMASLFSKESIEEKAGNLNEMTFKPKLRTTGGFPTVDSQDMMIEESLFIQRMAPNGSMFFLIFANFYFYFITYFFHSYLAKIGFKW